ncbi:sigma-70 family RNA polymerase sigma factor [Olivibacter sp. SDN3]|uniref:sigma-70 family RNA polymerase sigma factor n=1 Tax=Olivibacter sp. SDN3 TaxID=2764720 RepID=UPI0016515889|nr:sigma-70 family RNA polymerase sigma factor [Olivibacter sp. SDN3]QNL52320.1 sigma-70 family RNA polymerase sigma factor [Olivibacter sp. SDN3]
MSHSDFEQYRPLLLTYAYNILGSYIDAEDVVQDVFLRFLGKDVSAIENRKSYWIRSVINGAINLKKKQLNSRMTYPGEWLPEPVDTLNTQQPLVKEETLSYALLVLLERLNPVQRAVFILKEAYGYAHKEIADLLQISVDASKQVLTRSKKILQLPAKQKNKVQKDWLESYLEMMKTGDIEALEHLLVTEAKVVSDGGGKVLAALRPSIGRRAAFNLMRGLLAKYWKGLSHKLAEVNHQPAILFYEGNRLASCQIIDIEDDGISNIYIVRNPDKLKTLKHLSHFQD